MYSFEVILSFDLFIITIQVLKWNCILIQTFSYLIIPATPLAHQGNPNTLVHAHRTIPTTPFGNFDLLLPGKNFLVVLHCDVLKRYLFCND